jgi:xylulokinase
MTLSNTTRHNLARAAVEGVASLLGAALVGLRALDVPISRVTLVGGGARSEAVRQVGSAVWGLPVDVPTPGEDIADGAARQAAWVLAGSAQPPAWDRGTKTYESQPTPHVQRAYDITAARIMDLHRTDASS